MGSDQNKLLWIVQGWDAMETLKRKLEARGITPNTEEWYAAAQCTNTQCKHRIDLGDEHPYCSCIQLISDFNFKRGNREICEHASTKRPKEGYLVQPEITPANMQ